MNLIGDLVRTRIQLSKARASRRDSWMSSPVDMLQSSLRGVNWQTMIY